VVCRLPTEPQILENLQSYLNKYPGWDLNPQAPGFKPDRSAIGVPGPFAFEAEAVGLEPTSGPRPPPVFETGPSSSRMTSVRTGVDKKFRGLESNQRPPRSERGVTTTSNCPGFGKEDSNLHRLIQSQGAYRLADSRVESAPRESNPPVGPGKPAPDRSARDASHHLELRRQESNLRPPG
jgi:hypothetical protein